MAPGKFITFEGGEGSGKSTQARMLAERLEAAGIDVVATREPGGSPFAEQIRDLLLGGRLAPHPPLAEALLFYAARADHLANTIRPSLEAGRWVICDRFSDSTRVYQGSALGLDAAVLDQLERMVIASYAPNLTFILDLDPAVGLARVGARRTEGGASGGGSDPYEARSLEFHQRLRAGYLAIAKAEPDRCVLIDGSRSKEEAAAQIWTQLEKRLLAGRN